MTKLLLRTGVHPEELVLQAAQPLAHVQCCCRLQVCAGSDRVVQQASLGSMVKAQKSTGRKSTHCLRREVLKKPPLFGCSCPVWLPSLSHCGKHTSFMLRPNSTPCVILTTAIRLRSHFTPRGWVEKTWCSADHHIPLDTYYIIKNASSECHYSTLPGTVLSISIRNH